MTKENLKEVLVAFYKPVNDDGLMIHVEKKNCMDRIAELIEGYPTPIYLTDDLLVLVDEEAMIKPNPKYNFHLGSIPIYNHVLFLKIKGEEFDSVSFDTLKLIKTFVTQTEEV